MNPDYISTDPEAKKIIFLLAMVARTVFCLDHIPVYGL